MPFGRLSPVDETNSESEDESLNSSRTTSTDFRTRSLQLNFSRPSPKDYPTSRNITRDIHRDIQYATSSSSSSSVAGGSTRGIGAFYEAAPPKTQTFPSEPRFSSDDDGDDVHSVTASSRSNNSDLVWDADVGELRSRRLASTRPGNDYDAQRSAAPRCLPNRSYPPRNDSTSTTTSDQPLIAELPGDFPAPHIVILQQRQRRQQQEKEQQHYDGHSYQSSKEDSYRTSEDSIPGIPDKTPRIMKRTSLSQRSERLSISSVDNLNLDRLGTLSLSNSKNSSWNDSASHHTIKPAATPSLAPSRAPSQAPSRASSRPESGHSSLTSADWKSSEYDISGLSDKKLAKLKKKGINPQLYMEMKAARGGKGKLVGPLVGNTYIG
jgi:hypothetical protein